MLSRSERKRLKFLTTDPISDELWRWALRYHPIVDGLSPDSGRKLRDIAALFMHEKTFEGAKGLELTDEIRMSIALQAALPVLELGIDWYCEWSTVVVLPGDFIHRNVEHDRAGVVHEWDETDVGESWDEGPVALSWPDVEASGWADGFNVVIHEAAHRLDMTDGSVNGRPALPQEIDGEEWFEVCSRGFSLLERSAHRSKIDRYATESDAEFFAVLTEYFFEAPAVVSRELPELYALFERFYKQDPKSRLVSRRKAKRSVRF